MLIVNYSFSLFPLHYSLFTIHYSFSTFTSSNFKKDFYMAFFNDDNRRDRNFGENRKRNFGRSARPTLAKHASIGNTQTMNFKEIPVLRMQIGYGRVMISNHAENSSLATTATFALAENLNLAMISNRTMISALAQKTS